jgi:hypothetical protein
MLHVYVFLQLSVHKCRPGLHLYTDTWGNFYMQLPIVHDKGSPSSACRQVSTITAAWTLAVCGVLLSLSAAVRCCCLLCDAVCCCAAVLLVMPRGQMLPPGQQVPIEGPCQAVDFELEMVSCLCSVLII